MDITKGLGLIGGLAFLLICVPTQAATSPDSTFQASMPNASSVQLCLHEVKLAYDYVGSGRIRSYQYCSRHVFEPCKRAGGSYCYCNTRHHMCTYGHTENCNNCC